MADLKVLYINEDKVCIVSLPDGRYYYGNGTTFGGIGVSPNQFLRFNPYLNYVGDEDVPVPAAVLRWIEENVNIE